MVTQQLSLALDLTVAENIMLPELGRPGRYRTGAVTQRALISCTPSRPGHDFPARACRRSVHQPSSIVEIAKALALEAKIIFFDEPTAV